MRKILVISLLVVFAIQMTIYGQVSAKRSAELTDQVIKETGAVPVEYGLTAIAKDIEHYDEICSEITLKTVFWGNPEINSQGGVCTVKAENKSSLLEVRKVEDRVEIQITTKDKNNYIQLKEALNQVFQDKASQPKYYEYTKCSLTSNIGETHSKISSLLQSRRVKDLKEINIDNGYTITGYTGSGERIRNMGNYIDMNIAILSYKSGNYIIIGTPEIMTAY